MSINFTRAQVVSYITNKIDPQIQTILQAGSPTLTDLLNLAQLVNLRFTLINNTGTGIGDVS